MLLLRCAALCLVLVCSGVSVVSLSLFFLSCAEGTLRTRQGTENAQKGWVRQQARSVLLLFPRPAQAFTWPSFGDPGLPGEGAWRSLSFAFASLFERCRSGLRQTDRGAPFLGAVWCRECYGALSFCALRGHIGALDDDVKGEVAMQRVHEVVVAQRARVSRCDAS